MKKTICLLVLLALILCGCFVDTADKNGADKPINNQEYVKGVWISYSEINEMLMSGKFAEEFDKTADICAERGITDIIVHVRAFCNSLYKSEYFPLLDIAEGYDYDILEYIVESCHSKGIRIHAWINPYRVRTADSDTTKLSADSPAYLWLNDSDSSNDKNVLISNGIYLNPAEDSVRQLIIDGIREIVLNYKVDGIHFDDYFYPTTDAKFDEQSYEEYTAICEKPISLEEWRRANVNALISGSFTAVKFIDKDVIFSVSPMASIEKNYNELYADVEAWISSECVDWIIPQLYFGFEYRDENYRFEKLTEDWKGLCEKENTRLIIGLAPYKIGTESEPDRAEWANGAEVIKKQEEYCGADPDISGHIYFSLSSFRDAL